MCIRDSCTPRRVPRRGVQRSHQHRVARRQVAWRGVGRGSKSVIGEDPAICRRRDRCSRASHRMRRLKMNVRARSFLATAFVALSAAAAAQQPERIDTELNAKIREEGLDRSKIMWIEHYLTDVYGPRPIGSPNHVAAANWAMKTMTSWGMKNAHLEPFTWRGVGWLPGKATPRQVNGSRWAFF